MKKEKNIAEDYLVIAPSDKNTPLLISYEDERDFDITAHGTVSATSPVQFKCMDIRTLEDSEPDVDFYVANDILLSTAYSASLASMPLYHCSVLDASVNGADYLYLHCGNVIDIVEEDGFNFSRLANIPVEKRTLFKPSEDSMTYLFHRTFWEQLSACKPVTSSVAIPVPEFRLDMLA